MIYFLGKTCRNEGKRMVTREEFYVDSVDEIHMIHGFRWYNTDKAYKGVIQVVHGMLEYIERYDEFARAMAENGYFVIGHDHLGHGDSVKDSEELGYVGEQGAVLWLRDMEQIRRMAVSYAPKVPYIMLGHSMGSFITRDFAAKYGEELAGITICGTAGHFRGATEAESALLAAVAEGKGKESDPSFTADLMSWMCERCGNISIGNEWICSDPYVQRDHAEDPFDAFTRPTTNQSLLYFVQMMKAITGTEWAGKIPSDLPIYNIGGDQDPVGEYGKGIYEVTNWLVDTGHTVKTRVYSGYRHEIHNYDEIMNVLENDENVLGCYLSGAGPTLMAVIREEDKMGVVRLKEELGSLLNDWEVIKLELDHKGYTCDYE